MIKIGIIGYGNLAKGVECAIRQNPDMELKAVFTRRDPASVTIMTPDVPVLALSEAENWKDRIDVMILCGGSATDLPKMTPEFAKSFNVIDSFDTHAKIPEHFAAVDAAASAGGNVAFISVGWDPGLFSLQRLMGQCILPNGNDYTFWGTGISQGHSDAIRRIPGVLDAKQYTKFAKTKGQTAFEILEAAVDSGTYKKMTNAEKADFVKTVYEYANAKAKAEVSSYQLDGKNAKIAQAESKGIKPAQYLTITGGYDKNGNGSVSQEEAKAVLDKTNLTMAQKAYMWKLQNKSWKTNPYE